MTHLDNTRKTLITGVVSLLREEVSGWPLVDGDGFSGVENVWPSQTPQSVDNTFPEGSVDVISGTDIELSVDLDTKLRETVVRVVVFSDESGEIEDLIDQCENAVEENWENYAGDWSFRETDGFTELQENKGTEGFLRYNRSVDLVWECVRQNE